MPVVLFEMNEQRTVTFAVLGVSSLRNIFRFYKTKLFIAGHFFPHGFKRFFIFFTTDVVVFICVDDGE